MQTAWTNFQQNLKCTEMFAEVFMHISQLFCGTTPPIFLTLKGLCLFLRTSSPSVNFYLPLENFVCVIFCCAATQEVHVSACLPAFLPIRLSQISSCETKLYSPNLCLGKSSFVVVWFVCQVHVVVWNPLLIS